MRNARWLVLWVALSFVPRMSAQTFYATNEPKDKLVLVDFSTEAVSKLYKIGWPPDSLLVNSSGQIIYDVSPAPGSNGALYLFDPSTDTNTVLVPSLSYPRDLVFDPGQGSILISLYSQGKIARYNFVTGVVTKLPNAVAGTLDGIAYDPLGNLYGVVNHNKVCQIDPSTGATLQTLKLTPHNGIAAVTAWSTTLIRIVCG
jgi:sugar lactone lactonase YvrE